MTKNKRLLRRKAVRILSNLYAVLIYSIFYIPVAVMILFSFNDAKRNYYWQGFTTEWYGKLFSFANTDLWDALLYSLIIAVLATGAYNYSMASNYNRVPRPAVVFVRDGEPRVVVRRETYEDLTALDE